MVRKVLIFIRDIVVEYNLVINKESNYLTNHSLKIFYYVVCTFTEIENDSQAAFLHRKLLLMLFPG